MKLGIVGLPNVGKSTLFNSLTKAGAESANYPFCTIDPNVGVVTVPDERLKLLGDFYHSKKVTPAVIEFVDIAGLVKGASKGEGLGNQFLANIREVDAIVHVVRCFEDPNVIHVDGSIDPLRDIETINLELIFSDIEILERRIAKVTKTARMDKEAAKELDFLQRGKKHLEDGNMAITMELENEDEEILNEYKDFADMFRLMEKLALILRQRRFKRGSIDFDFPETKITLNDKGEPVEIKPYDRNTATRIIEDFMLIANETVAEDYFWQEIPFLYRSHENPDPEKIRRLGTFINNFGYSIKIGDEIHPKELQKLLGKIEGSDEENLIARLTLRSMKRASYTTECVGHFGLAAKYYCHFTSPIRRYPDLQIHRIIKENLHGGMSDKRSEHFAAILPEVAKQTSATERRADDAERDTDKLKMVQYMEKHIGETFEGVVSGMTAWGIYVELPNTIEGMISVASLRDGYYIYDENHYEMVNETTGRTFKLGQRLNVKVINCDKILRTIDFELAE